MFSTVLLLINIVLLIYLLVYGTCFLLLPFIRSPKRKTKEASLPEDGLSGIIVLVPCHHEGEAIVSTVESLIKQGYRGPLDIVVLIADADDSSYQPLLDHFQVEPVENEPIVLLSKDNRTVRLVCTGTSPKREKLNLYLPQVETPYVAFLDADHRAKIDWLSSSVDYLHDPEYAAVQSRRAPLSLKKVPQLWDSAQNHIGNELTSETLLRVAGTTFFTGTTGVFRTDVLKGREFGDCVTEDTYLSYELIRDGHRIGFNTESGSNEEVAPDLHSYIARRRRWSCGHNHTFFSLARRAFAAPIPKARKLAILLHGLFYTIPVVVCLCLNVLGLHLLVQYSSQIQLVVALIAMTLALAGSLFMFGRHRHILRETIVLFLFIFPQITLFFPAPLYLTENELYYFLTQFPFMTEIGFVQLFCINAPLVLLALGSFRLPVLPIHQLLLVLITYPLVIFFDLWATLLGFSDFLFGRPTWAKIQRTQEEDNLAKGERANSLWIVGRTVLTLASAVFLVISFNDLTAESNCGSPEGVLFDPTIFVPESEITWKLRTSERFVAPDSIEVTFENSVEQQKDTYFEISHFVDGKQVGRSEAGDAQSFTFKTKAGWDSHQYEARLKSAGTLCKRTLPFDSSHRELKDDSLYVNGEPFLVKGVIPSFSPLSEAVTMDLGIRQIKRLGANTVRYYHQLTARTQELVEQEQLLVLDQPERSTWRDVNLNLLVSRKLLERRFQKLVEENRGFPYTLFHILGNEIEIENPEMLVPELVDLIEELLAEDPDNWFAYATYFVYLNFPTPVGAINMLDAGETYWKKAVKVIKGQGKPFLATELGGFVAYTERTPEHLRSYRLREHWNRLMEAGAFGAVIHQSHDNYAQPIVSGLNDPLTPDHPDDERGIWDVDNRPKPVHAELERLFGDLEVNFEGDLVKKGENTLSFTITNKRPYSLVDVVVSVAGKKLKEIGTFAPHESKVVSFDYSIKRSTLSLRFKYTTHAGLSATSIVRYRLPLQDTVPSIVNSDVVDVVATESDIAGTLITSDAVEVVFPADWKRVRLAGTELDVTEGKNAFPLRSAMEQAIELESSVDAKQWKKIEATEVGKGPNRLRFKLPRSYPEDALLILTGLGNSHFWIKTEGQEDWTKLESHKYRPNLISLKDFGNYKDEYFYLLLPRFETTFLSGIYTDDKKPIKIDFEMPKIFSPVEFRIERVL